MWFVVVNPIWMRRKHRRVHWPISEYNFQSASPPVKEKKTQWSSLAFSIENNDSFAFKESTLVWRGVHSQIQFNLWAKIKFHPKEERLMIVFTDSQTDVLKGLPLSADCVQDLDDSRNSAIHTMYRISLRSSSMWEPRYPSPTVILFGSNFISIQQRVEWLKRMNS